MLFCVAMVIGGIYVLWLGARVFDSDNKLVKTLAVIVGVALVIICFVCEESLANDQENNAEEMYLEIYDEGYGDGYDAALEEQAQYYYDLGYEDGYDKGFEWGLTCNEK